MVQSDGSSGAVWRTEAAVGAVLSGVCLDDGLRLSGGRDERVHRRAPVHRLHRVHHRKRALRLPASAAHASAVTRLPHQLRQHHLLQTNNNWIIYQDPNAGNSRVAECRSQKDQNTIADISCHPSQQHANGTDRLKSYDLLLAFYSTLGISESVVLSGYKPQVSTS